MFRGSRQHERIVEHVQSRISSKTSETERKARKARKARAAGMERQKGVRSGAAATSVSTV